MEYRGRPLALCDSMNGDRLDEPAAGHDSVTKNVVRNELKAMYESWNAGEISSFPRQLKCPGTIGCGTVRHQKSFWLLLSSGSDGFLGRLAKSKVLKSGTGTDYYLCCRDSPPAQARAKSSPNTSSSALTSSSASAALKGSGGQPGSGTSSPPAAENTRQVSPECGSGQARDFAKPRAGWQTPRPQNHARDPADLESIGSAGAAANRH